MKNQKILITGASGQIGRGLVHVLSKENEVHALARFSKPGHVPDIEKKAAKLWALDMGREKPNTLPQDFDVIFHMAVGWAGDDTLESQNESFHLSCDFVAELMKQNSPAIFVLGSTGSVYQRIEGFCKEDETPLQGGTTYVTSKIAMSRMARWLSAHHHHRVTELRYWMPYAPYAPHTKVDTFLNGDIIGNNPDALHERTYIAHHIEKTIKAAAHARTPIEIFNCASEEKFTSRRLAEIGAQITGSTLSEKARGAGRPGGTGHFADTEKAVRVLGSTPIPVEEGFRRYWRARQENIITPEDWMFEGMQL